jgi:hypothetical protein
MPKKAFVILCVYAAMSQGSVRGAGTSYSVKYLSSENVYLNAGQADGLAVGDHLTITSSGKCRTEVEIVFAADHSASCKVVSGDCTLAVGDKAERIATAKPDSLPAKPDTAAALQKTDSIKAAPAAPSPVPKSFGRPAQPNLSGSISLLYYYWNDQSVSNLDFSQTTARLNLKARRLFGKEITFSLRTRGRYDQRDRAYSSAVAKNAWENRVWEFSFTYDDPKSPYGFAFGRLLSRRISSAGYLDGLLLERRISGNVVVGMFGGTEPQWAYADGQLSLNKGGGYLTFTKGDPGKAYLEQSLAAIGQYHGTNVSRELISSQGRYSSGSRWGYYHTAEFDINRSWRKEKAGQTLTLSSLYLGTYYRASDRLRLSLSYDNRKSYWTYDTKSVVDSLFDDHLRQGIRGQVDLSLPLLIQTSGSYGVNKRTGDSASSKAYSLYVSKSGLLNRTAVIMLQYSGFRGPFEHGDNYSVRMSDNLAPTVQVALAYGIYDYEAVPDGIRRKNNWFEVSTTADFSRRVFFLGSIESDRGDDIKGVRIQTELGCRF